MSKWNFYFQFFLLFCLSFSQISTLRVGCYKKCLVGKLVNYIEAHLDWQFVAFVIRWQLAKEKMAKKCTTVFSLVKFCGETATEVILALAPWTSRQQIET
jgi:hypothetical protein